MKTLNKTNLKNISGGEFVVNHPAVPQACADYIVSELTKVKNALQGMVNVDLSMRIAANLMLNNPVCTLDQVIVGISTVKEI